MDAFVLSGPAGKNRLSSRSRYLSDPPGEHDIRRRCEANWVKPRRVSRWEITKMRNLSRPQVSWVRDLTEYSLKPAPRRGSTLMLRNNTSRSKVCFLIEITTVSLWSD
jgi:hypothetical protein